MDNSSNMAVNTTPMTNQINPEHHYGLDKNKALPQQFMSVKHSGYRMLYSCD